MTPAEQLKQNSVTLASNAQHQDGLAAHRGEALDKLRLLPFPEKKQEAWKYTGLNALTAGQLERVAPALSADADIASSIPSLGDCLIVVGNGVLTGQLPAPNGLSITPLSADSINDASPDTFFGWLNTASLSHGLLLKTEPNVKVAGIVHLVFFNQAQTPCHATNRLQIELAEGSELTVIEHYIGSGPILTNALTHIQAGANSRLTHYRLQSESADSLHIGNLQIDQQRDSRVDSSQLMRGNVLRRNDVHVRMLESGADLAMRGVFIARDKSHIDNHINVEHVAPHCHSDQVYKGIAGENGRAVFNGRIHIHQYAKGSDAGLSNNNMLLSNEAEIDSKPELEIYNDDVKCAHGTTIGQMDAGQLFYLRSRGIDAASAKRMLGTGFVNETLHAMQDEAVREWATQWLGEAL
ncbi:Fe-S cluster assembly protein SufD [Alcanivorax sp. 1008]|uniref:Fe-S cluster assembly protein SufD n=1 Tax=Alcanivorax sp. 1008 TaxID=2816853 RepID=UPI001D24FBB4|nr:Fe-S cluster assembly protein SufD [Alcanivorax sp. 1008]MCC1497308.1 Fe-S cluster assembly protein SufD [Alcanivorax sp. 1008]